MVNLVPENTPRLGLPKPTGNENVTRVNYTELIDTIDTAAAKKSDVDTHLGDNVKHITATERTNWNAKETPSGAQAKVDTHAADEVKHITSAERTTWNAKQNALGFTPANKAGEVFTGSVEAPHFNAGQWGQYSSGTNGHVLLGHNCYIDKNDSNKYKFRNTHANIGARGIIFQFIAGVTVPKYFDTGAIATTAGQEFTPTFTDMWHAGNMPQTRINNGHLEFHDGTGWKKVSAPRTPVKGSFITSSTSFVTALEVTGSGRLTSLRLHQTGGSSGGVYWKLTMDGKIISEGDTSGYTNAYVTNGFWRTSDDGTLDISFKESLKIEIRAINASYPANTYWLYEIE